MGDINLAKQRGLIAAYLNIAAIIFSLVVAVLAIGLTLGLYLPTYYLDQCKDESMCCYVRCNQGVMSIHHQG